MTLHQLRSLNHATTSFPFSLAQIEHWFQMCHNFSNSIVADNTCPPVFSASCRGRLPKAESVTFKSVVETPKFHRTMRSITSPATHGRR